MEATSIKKETIKTLKTFEIAIPEEYAATIRKLIQGLGGKIKVRKEKKCGLDEALEDVKAGRVSKVYTNIDEWHEIRSTLFKQIQKRHETLRKTRL